ncbi:putative nuclease [Chlorella virus XW01]|nr:putative nuclease [Chlorella virus XW01]
MLNFFLKRRINKLSWDNCEKFIPDFEYGKVIKVYDGDTITLGTILQGKPYKFSIRLEGIDAPELKTQNDTEKKAGYLVKSKLESLILNKMVKINITGYDKYGRLLGKINYNNICINDWLLENKYCYKYTGQTKSIIDWSYLLSK